MGQECYLLRLHGKRSDAPEVAEYIQQRFGATPDPTQPPLSAAYSHFVFRDGLHVIEYEFYQASDSCGVSMRFALCHPPSVDPIFLAQACDLVSHFGLDATICEELPAGAPRVYAAADLDRFAANGAWSIAQSRGYWRQMFGPDEAGLSVRDARGRFFFGAAPAELAR